MASRRAVVNLVHAPTPSARIAAPARIQAAAQLSLRRFHHHAQFKRVRVPQQSSTFCTSQTSPPLRKSNAARQLAPTRRAYSADAEGKPPKIWDFEAVQKVTNSPNRSTVIIDVREPHELEQTGRIPGALNIPVTSAPDSFHIPADEFEDRFGYPRPPPDAEVVFYCRSGVRSRAAAGLAKEAGWTNVGEYPGSWLDWSERG
ncbi:ecb24421-8323-48c9-9003-b7717ac3dd64 [Thermothielavioides terrestris]|nr:ecb24421-8323-48c9-9003-b7717ac3dd64 [Thermothielavioides terrestris]